ALRSCKTDYTQSAQRLANLRFGLPPKRNCRSPIRVKRPAQSKDWLPLARAGTPAAELPTGEAFRREWIDFRHGIRVGNLEPHERITQILKFHLETKYRTPFVTDRWGRDRK